MSVPRMSIVIPVFNGRDYIVETLRSLDQQTVTDFEIVVVDDGSTDGVGDVVREFAASRDNAQPEIRLLRQDNAGVSSARNHGIREARAELIGFVDADDLWAPEKAALHIALMAEQPQLDLTYSGFDFINGDGGDEFDGIIPPAGILPLEKLMLRNLIHTGTVVARRAAILQCDGFDTQLKAFEDFDLWLKIAALRPDNVFGIARALACYRRHGDQATGSWRNMRSGWETVAARLEREHPAIWAKTCGAAWICNTEYCASLAHRAGEIADMRTLIKHMWRKGGWENLRHKNALFMTGVWLTTYLPQRAQELFVEGYFKLRQGLYLLRPASKTRAAKGSGR